MNEGNDDQAAVRLVQRILTSWAITARLLVIVSVLVGLAVGGLAALQVDLEIGPVTISRR